MIHEIEQMIAGIDERIEWLTSLSPPRDVGFLISARGVLRGRRDDWEHGCSSEHVREAIAEIREIVGTTAELPRSRLRSRRSDEGCRDSGEHDMTRTTTSVTSNSPPRKRLSGRRTFC